MKTVCAIIVLFPFLAFSQILKGTVTDQLGIVPFATVVIKNGSIIKKFTTTDAAGNFDIKIEKPSDSIDLEISTLRHEVYVKTIKDILLKKNTDRHSFYLQPRVSQLKEVVIKQQAKISVRKDTVEYNPASFIDGSEKVVEDLLKKLPGFQVSDNGQISYKGIEIKKMLLDGDDLFGGNYTVGSKNIDVDMIEKVQGLEHFDNNSILKSIRNSDDVAVNLVLKKGKIDISGTANVGGGYQNRADVNASLLLVNKKIKGFGVLSYNNVGRNSSPYDFNSNVIALENIVNTQSIAKTLINNGDFTSMLESGLHNINNMFYTSLNTLQKIKKKSNLKILGGFYNDKLSRLKTNKTSISTTNESFEFYENNDLQKNPSIIDFKIHFENKEKSNFQWEYLPIFNKEKTNFLNKSDNNGISQTSNVLTDKTYFSQKLNATIRLAKNQAIETTLDVSMAQSLQSLLIDPSTIINNQNNVNSSIQKSVFEKRYTRFDVTYYANFGKLKFTTFANYIKNANMLRTELSQQNGSSLSSEFTNNVKYTTKNLSIRPVLSWEVDRFFLKIGLDLGKNSLLVDDFNIAQKAADFYFMPSAMLMINLGEHNKIVFDYKLDKFRPDEQYMYAGVVQTDYRTFQSNAISTDFLNAQAFKMSYKYNDAFNSSRYNLSVGYAFRPNNYFFNTTINQNITMNNRFFANISAKNYNISAFAEKYIHPIRTTFQTNCSYQIQLGADVFNNSQLRQIQNNIFSIKTIARRKLTKTLAADNTMLYNSYSVSIAESAVSNNFQTVGNQLKLLWNTKKNLTGSLTYNNIIPNLKYDNRFVFLDFELSLKSKNKKIQYGIVAKNLTKNSNFSIVDVNSFSTSISAHNVVERYAMFKVDFNF